MVKRIQVTLDQEEYKLFRSVPGNIMDGTKAKAILMSYIYSYIQGGKQNER